MTNDTTADTAAADLATRADAEAIRLAWTLDAADVAAAMHGTARAVAARLHGSTEETTARADALARALRAISNGLDVEHAINAASRDAVADAVARAASVSLWSLDATTGDGTTTLADMLDGGHVGTARLSQYDEGAGIYRGVARVPHPEDITRPIEMPAPEQMQETARDSLTPEARRILDVTAAVNVAAEIQRRAAAADLAALAADVAADATRLAASSRSSQATQAKKTAKDAKEAARVARRDVRAEHAPYRPRTTEVAAALGRSTSGRARVALAADQESANAAYWTHRDALAVAALDAWTERLDESAEIQRSRRDNTRARAEIGTRWDRVTTYGLAHLARAGRRAAALAALEDACTLTAPQPPAQPAAGITLADPYDAAHGTRPRRSLAEWDTGRALPGSSRRPSARLASPNAPAHDPQRSRTADDVERTDRRTHTAPHAPVAPAPRQYVPGPNAPIAHGLGGSYVIAPADRAEFAARRDLAARIARALVSVGWPASEAYALAYAA